MMTKTPLPEKLSAPSQRALAGAGIRDLETLSTYTEKEILSLHGVGKTVMVKLKNAMQQHNLSFKQTP